jgi:zinc transporter ZupT
LSGMVEPIAGILGAFAVMLAEPLLPYTLAFAAGAMIYVVIDDIIPEAQTGYVMTVLLHYVLMTDSMKECIKFN